MIRLNRKADVKHLLFCTTSLILELSSFYKFILLFPCRTLTYCFIFQLAAENIMIFLLENVPSGRAFGLTST